MSRFVWIVAIATACSGSDETSQGTVVGNPGDTSMQLARTAGVDVVEAYTFVDTFEWVDCDGDRSVVDVQSEINLLDESSVEGPSGEWCSLTVQLGDTLVIEAALVDDGDDEILRFQLDLDVEYLQMNAQDGFVIDGDSTVIELGQPDWFVLEEIELEDDEGDGECEEIEERMEELWEACEDGDEDACEELDEVGEWYDENCTEDDEEESERTVRINPDSSAHDGLARRFMLGSALYEDGNADGRLSDDERNAGAVATGTEHPDSVDEDGSVDDTDANIEFGTQGEIEVGGCGRSESNLAWLLLPFTVFRLRRSHR
jgi:hypothetical protein